MKWILAPIDSHLEDIKTLFAKTEGHKHANNYSKWPLFQHTKENYNFVPNFIDGEVEKRGSELWQTLDRMESRYGGVLK